MISNEKWKNCVINVAFGNEESSTDKRNAGTAIFLNYKNKHFLITAAHLLINKEISSNLPIKDRLFKQMFRILSFNEWNDENKRKLITKKVLIKDDDLTYCYGETDHIPIEKIAIPKYILVSDFNEPTISPVTILEREDIAIISLRPRIIDACLMFFTNEKSFTKELIVMGYSPITIDDIRPGPFKEGSEVFTVGYPADISPVKTRKEIYGKYERWCSAEVTLPIFAFGKISMVNKDLDYFWADLPVFPGNSGSPLIEEDKLVGIITNEAVIEIGENIEKFPFARAIKTKFIKNLVEMQIEKDEKFIEEFRRSNNVS